MLTGFGPFPGVANNISADLVEALGAQAAQQFKDYRVIAHVLPTEWVAGPELLANLYNAHMPVLSLHFGVSEGAIGFRIETQAVNSRGRHCDAAGQLPEREIILAQSAKALQVTAPARDIVARLKRLQIPAELSTNAGTFLCNSVLYRSLHLCGCATGPTMAGFIHMPTAFTEPVFGLDTAIAGGIEIIRVCLERLRVGPATAR